MSEENEVVEVDESIEGQETTVEETPPTTGEDAGTVETVEEPPAPTAERTVPLAALEDERRKRQDSERRLDAFIQSQQQQRQPEQPPQAPEVPQRPTLEQFEFDEDKYQDALMDYRVNAAIKVRDDANDKQRKEVQQRKYLQDYQTRVDNINQLGVKAHEDYVAKVVENSGLKITPLMADIISQSENGHNIAYHLGSNLEEAATIAQMPPHLQAAAIGRLEAKLGATPTKVTTKAPQPITPVGGGGGQATVDDDSLTDEEWGKKYHKR